MSTPRNPHQKPIATTFIAMLLGLSAIGCSQAISSPKVQSSPASTATPQSAEPIVKVHPDQPITGNNNPTEIAQAPTPAKILEGRYWVGATGQGLEVSGDRYRYDDEEGPKPWRSLSELESIKSGVIFDGNAYWCLASMAPKSGATACSETGWVKPIATTAPIGNRAALFACTTENGKEITLFETETTIDYSFGRPGQRPELELKVPRDQASTWQWHGFGRWMNYSVSVPNGDTTYTVFSGVDKLSPRKESGVEVRRNGETLTTVNCTKVMTDNLRGVQLQPTQI
ncbi:MAG: hypothetical protein RLZZ511_740 [Cyanobacteriota bacterium]|jgi:hypothetical protein